MELFYSKYSPKTLYDFEISDNLFAIFDSLINTNTLNILFYGDSYSGKTEISKKLIDEYYKGFNKSLINNNLLFINQLQEQGINFYKSELNTFCQIKSGITGKKKIIFIDDMHLINNQCQQIFKNFLEKYKSNIMIISTTSNVQKIIESLKSRLIMIELLHPSTDYIYKFIKNIILCENILIKDEESISLIVKLSGNSMKRCINHLEKLKLLDKEINSEIILNVIMNNNYINFKEYTEHLKNGNLFDAVLIIMKIFNNGFSVIDILETYFTYIKIVEESLKDNIRYEIIELLCKYITIFYTKHENEIELLPLTNNIYKVFKQYS